MRHLTANDFQVSTWSGGKTVQIAISPEGAAYAERNFLWRVSSATVELDESAGGEDAASCRPAGTKASCLSVFTALPDYHRWIFPLSGTMSLSHNGGPVQTLKPHEAHFFDGADATHCRGRCTDFNLMLRKGRCEGRILALTEDAELGGKGVKVLYCAQGSVTVNGLFLREGEAARLDEGERGRVHFPSPGVVAAAVISEKQA